MDQVATWWSRFADYSSPVSLDIQETHSNQHAAATYKEKLYKRCHFRDAIPRQRVMLAKYIVHGPATQRKTK
jgi:hypothetical protein